MARIIPFRRRRDSVRLFEETLAHLQEELALTETFANAMVREGQLGAAVGVIDEQRRRLAQSETEMRDAFRPRRRRLQVMGGIAAVMAIGTASFAALNLRAPAAGSAPAAIERAEQKLDRAEVAGSSAQAQALVTDALDELSAIEGEIAADPQINNEVRGILERQLELLKKRPELRSLMVRIKAVAKQVRVDVAEAAKQAQQTTPPPAPSPSPEPSTGAPQPPAR